MVQPGETGKKSYSVPSLLFYYRLLIQLPVLVRLCCPFSEPVVLNRASF